MLSDRFRIAPRHAATAAIGLVLALGATPGTLPAARAQPVPAPAPAQSPEQPTAEVSQQKPAAAPTSWGSGINLSAQIEGGITGTTASPANGVNFGQLTTDKPDHVILNQILLTAERPLDPKNSDFDVGFKLQALYGSDARIYHYLGEFTQLIHDRNQFEFVEANVTAHLPVLFSGGIDVKAGQYPTPLGYEVIDPKANPFYSHSYMYGYGLPFVHTGVLTTSHVSSVLDVYLGIDSGSNTTLGSGDNNDQPGGIFGFGLNLLGGNLTVVALTHAGPDNPTRTTPFGNSAMRYYNDVVTTYKATDALSFTLDVNYSRDDGFGAEAYGGAGYVSYALNDKVTLNGRAEVYRDNNNFFVTNPRGNLDFANAQIGLPANLVTAPSPTTYSELTLGVTYKPSGLPQPVSGLLIRPEVRFDRALNGVRVYDNGKNQGQYTLAVDGILGF